MQYINMCESINLCQILKLSQVNERIEVFRFVPNAQKPQQSQRFDIFSFFVETKLIMTKTNLILHKMIFIFLRKVLKEVVHEPGERSHGEKVQKEVQEGMQEVSDCMQFLQKSQRNCVCILQGRKGIHFGEKSHTVFLGFLQKLHAISWEQSRYMPSISRDFQKFKKRTGSFSICLDKKYTIFLEKTNTDYL